MKKELRDYLHLYLGCEIIGTYRDASGSKGYLTGVTNGGCDCEIQFILEDGINVEEEPCINDISQVKPILRPLSSITEEEVAHLFNVDINALVTKGNFCPPFFQVEYIDDYGEETFEHRYLNQLDPEQFRFLLSKHFDLFGLIEAGLAIDATTLKQKS